MGKGAPHPFSEVVVMTSSSEPRIADSSPDDFHDDDDSLLNITVRMQTRSNRPKFTDICEARIKSDWFMIIDDDFELVKPFSFMVHFDGSKRPLQAFVRNKDTDACARSATCREAIE